MKDLGKICTTYEGLYDNTKEYEALSLVDYRGVVYCSKKTTLGHLPTDTEYWFVNAKGAYAAAIEAGYTEDEATFNKAIKDVAVSLVVRPIMIDAETTPNVPNTTLYTKGEVNALLADKQDKITGKGLSTEDFTTLLKQKLEALSNYDDSEVRSLIVALQTAINTINGTTDTTTIINSLKEINAFLEGYNNTLKLSDLLSTKVDKVSGKGLSTVDYSTEDFNKLASIQTGALKNAPNTVIDAQYVHTDNNYTTSEKNDVAKITALSDKIDAIALGVATTISISPSVIYKGIQNSITINGYISKVTSNSLKLYEGNSTGTLLQSNTDSTSISYTNNYTLSTDKEFTIVANYKGMELISSTSLLARYPIYAGFGKNTSEVAIDNNKLSARTSANASYSGTASKDNVNYYILVPSDIPALSNFTMGGAPFVMVSSIETINDISYKVYKSGAIYNNGAIINIQAS